MTNRQIMTKRKLAAVGTLAALATLGFGFSRSGLLTAEEPGTRGAAASPSLLLPVSATRLERTLEYTRRRTYTGQLEARRASELGFERDGLLTEVRVREGDRVEAGEVLAQLDSARLDAQRAGIVARRAGACALLCELRAGPREEVVEMARAALGEVEQELELAHTRLARRRELVEKNAVSREVVEEAERGVDVLVARLDARQSALDELVAGTREEQVAAQAAVVESLDAELEALEVELRKSELVAPFAVTIARRWLDEGSVVAPGRAVLRLIEDDVLEVRLGVPQGAAKLLAAEQRHPLRVGDGELEAKVIAVLPELDTRTRTVTVILGVDARESGALPGQIAELQLDERVEARGFWLPVTALSRGQHGLWSSYALVEDGDAAFTVERRDVEVLYTDGGRALVRGALRDGERVIDAGLHRVVPGQRVRVD